MRLAHWSLLIIIILNSCDPTRLFEENIDFEDKAWLSDDVIVFDFHVPESRSRYNIYFNLRNTMEYPHYNIYISFKLKDSLNQVLHQELVNFDLFDAKSGDPLGKSGLGDIFDHQFLLLENYEFQETGLKRLELQQYMRYDSLPEIISTGMRIESILN